MQGAFDRIPLLSNPWCVTDDDPNLIDVLKFGAAIVKLVFNSYLVPEISTKQGISMVHMNIPAQSISEAKFLRLKICYTCNKHYTTNGSSQIATNPELKKCSTCSSRDHIFLNCNTDRRHFKCFKCDEITKLSP